MRMTTEQLADELALIARTQNPDTSMMLTVRAELERRFVELIRIERPSAQDLEWWQDALRLTRDELDHLLETFCPRPTAKWPPAARETR
jgi:hypothetical protein